MSIYFGVEEERIGRSGSAESQIIKLLLLYSKLHPFFQGSAITGTLAAQEMSILHIYFPFHLFCANWQREQWKSLVQNLLANHCAIELDFSENYSFYSQEKAQSCHWSKTQCTTHSCVLWWPSVPIDATDRVHVKEH